MAIDTMECNTQREHTEKTKKNTTVYTRNMYVWNAVKCIKKRQKTQNKKKSDNTVNEGGDWRETV